MRINSTFAALAFGSVSLFAGRARANPDCTTLSNPVYIEGSTAIGPVVLQLAAALAVQTQPITLVYAGTGSCAGVSTIINTVTSPSTSALVTPSTKTDFFTYYDSMGKQQSCDIMPLDGGPPVYIDIALSDVFADSCQPLSQTLKALGIDERLGPVQAMTFVVPKISSQRSISAEAAYLTYGFGGKDPNIKTPWSDIMSMFQRGASSGTQAMIAKAIGVPSKSWYGVTPSYSMPVLTGTPAMVKALTDANTAMNGNAIGILGAADIDPLVRIPAITGGTTPTVRELPYQHYKQNCGYLPDSSEGVFDKKNVRDGHYAIWGPLHVFTRQHSTNVDTVVNDLTGFTQVGTLDVIAAEAQAGLIPQCAMRVQRSTEMGDLSPISQTAPCGCYYEKSVFHGSTSCQTCQKTADCTMANYSCQVYGSQGYCEPP
jgi:hypothetical protein